MESEVFDVTSYYYDSIELLRASGDIILHSNFISPSEDDEMYVAQLLEKEYQKEGLVFPGEIPTFNSSAALWGAKTVFIAAQLLLIRDISELEFTEILPPYKAEMDEGAVLSCDLCLRFLPHIIERAEDIDTYDGLIPHLESLLTCWPYSGIGRRFITKDLNVSNSEILSTRSMQLLVVDRVVERKAQHSIPNELRKIIKPFIYIDLDDTSSTLT